MPIPDTSIGVVTPEVLHFDEPIKLVCGRSLAQYDIVYETYGTLNADASNAVLICHALSSDHHAAGYHSEEDRKPGWWENCIGPNKPIDTDKFFVVSLNNLGGCSGSTGPNTINPETGKEFGADFPIVTVKDWVQSQALFSDRLGIQRWAAVIGGSLGGMQAMQWAIDFPDRLSHAVVIAATPKLSAQNIAFNEVARQSIVADPKFHEGRYYDFDEVPDRGLALARMLGHLTYLSDEGMRSKFGRELREGKINFGFDVEFQIESYLRYQGNAFVNRFDANTYLLMTKALDYFDPAADFDDDLTATLANVQASFLAIAFTTDWRFAPERSREIVKALQDNRKNISYAEIESKDGHDAFLIKDEHYFNVFHAYMDRVFREVSA